LGSLNALDHGDAKRYAGLVSDWEVVEEDDQETLLQLAQRKHLISHCVSMVHLSLMLKAESSIKFVLDDIENSLGVIGSHASVLSELLVAPFEKRDQLSSRVNLSLKHGFGASANLFHRLYDLQSVLSRFSNIWINLSLLSTAGLGCTKEDQWNELVKTGYLVQLLEAENLETTKSIFGKLAFSRSTARERANLAHLGREIGELLFVVSALPKMEQDEGAEADSKFVNHRGLDYASSKEELGRVLMEIDRICFELANGKDHLAFRYLNELLERQKSEFSVDYAVKSLCNIAKRCADMFRTDFEAHCIYLARDLDPSDSWTLIQLGDHLKRVGEYEQAEEVVKGAQDYLNIEIAQSLLADIASVRGDFDLAIQRYRNISDWENSPNILTAIADNFRRKGEYKEALAIYLKIEENGFAADRALAGKAQILLRQGGLNEAINIYQSILKNDLDDKSRVVYQVTYAGLLKQAGRIDDAVITLEEVLEAHPFVMKARVLRSSLYALKDELTLAIENLPVPSVTYSYSAFGEWVAEYTRGLLLLRLERYGAAKEGLIRNYLEGILESEQKEVLRLASAVSILAVGDTHEARELLRDTTTTVNNNYLEYLRAVLEFHISVLENNSKKIDELYEFLYQSRADNVILWGAVQALREGNPEEAIHIEIESMLRFAA
jgi:tetratricopeptide (TPR) repeat protein